MFERAISRIGKLTLPCAYRNASQGNEQQTIVFPPEVVEKFLERVSDTKTLFTCRLVNRHWNAIASNMLERCRLKHWTSWHPAKMRPIPNLLPLIVQNGKCNDGECSEVKLPPPLKAFRNLIRNPFPNKSLSVFNNPYCLNKKRTASHEVNTEWDAFWIEMGPYLSSIILCDIQITESQVSLILTSTPNLKALTFYNGHILQNSSLNDHRLEEMDNHNINISSNLQHLHLFNQSDEFRGWLLDKCAHQLVSLSIADYSGEQEWYTLHKIVNLKHLKICTPPLIILDKIENSSISTRGLEFLSIAVDRVEDISLDSFSCIMRFISKNSVSLIHLELNVTLDMLVKFLEDKQIIFPNVKLLALERSNEEKYEKQRVSNWFPNVESVIDTP